MARLDKKQPYFSVHGHAASVAFEQGGCLFDADGEEVVMEPTAQQPATETDTPAKPEKVVKAPKATKAKPEKVVKADVATEGVTAPTSVVDEQLAAQGAA